jgi:hypothetical protein
MRIFRVLWQVCIGNDKFSLRTAKRGWLVEVSADTSVEKVQWRS